MKKLLNKLTHNEFLTQTEAKSVLIDISKERYNPSQVVAFLTVFMMRDISLEELEGFRNALLELCIPVDFSDYDPIDLCGTGGDGKNTFNISTLSAFVTAGAGIPVAKHGNYGVSSNCGSSNILEYFGIKFTNDKDFLKKTMDKAGIAILHAPLFHPAMKFVAPLRKDLQVKTFFNILGPMVNPCSPKKQIVGVFNLKLLRLYGYLYQRTEKRYSIVYDLEGYDEISTTGKTKIISNNSEYIFDPNNYNFSTASQEAIQGGNNIEDSAKIFMKILSGKGSQEQNNVVFANAGLAISTHKGISLAEGIKEAKISLLEKKALQTFKALQELGVNS